MKNKRFLISVLILTLLPVHILMASVLPTQAFLGVAGPIENVESSDGAIIERVFPGGTGEMLKLQAGDLIKKVNDVEIKNFQHLIVVLKNIIVGQEINISGLRNKKFIELAGVLMARPQEQGNTAFDVIYDSVKVNNSQLRSIIYRPKASKEDQKFPALYFIQGYTCASIDYGLYPNSTGNKVLQSIAEAGYVVYKIEKFSIGDSIGDIQCSEINFTTELTGFIAGLKALKSYDFVDGNNIHLFGHSLGGVYAPFIARQSTVKSLISYGSVVKPWFDYIQDIYLRQALIFGTSKVQAVLNSKTVTPLLKAWLKTDEPWSEIIADKQYQTALTSQLIPVSGDQVFHRHYTFFRDLNDYDLAKAWQETTSNVLAIHGSLDIQAIDEDWATQMVAMAKKDGIKVKRVILEGAEHGFMRYESMANYLEARNDRSYNPMQPGNGYDPRVAETIINWLNSLSKS